MNHYTEEKGWWGSCSAKLKFYFWSFTLRPISIWCDPTAFVSWRNIEENIVRPWNLQDVLFANISDKLCQLRFGPIVSHLIRTWRTAERGCKISCKLHSHSPVYNNKGLLIGGRPISPSYWSGSNIHHLNDIYDNMGLRSFQDIRGSFDLPGS